MLKNFITKKSCYEFVFSNPAECLLYEKIKQALAAIEGAEDYYSANEIKSTQIPLDDQGFVLQVSHLGSKSAVNETLKKVQEVVFFTLQLFDDSLDDDVIASNFYKGLATSAASGQHQTIDVPLGFDARFFAGLMKCSLGAIDLRLNESFGSISVPFLRLALIKLFDDLIDQPSKASIDDAGNGKLIKDIILLACRVKNGFERGVLGLRLYDDSTFFHTEFDRCISLAWKKGLSQEDTGIIAKFYRSNRDSLSTDLDCFDDFCLALQSDLCVSSSLKLPENATQINYDLMKECLEKLIRGSFKSGKTRVKLNDGALFRAGLQLEITGIDDRSGLSSEKKLDCLTVLAYQLLRYAVQLKSDPFKDAYETVLGVQDLLTRRFIGGKTNLSAQKGFIKGHLSEIGSLPECFPSLKPLTPLASSSSPSVDRSKSPFSKPKSFFFSKKPSGDGGEKHFFNRHSKQNGA